jgi:hypothetical protein
MKRTPLIIAILLVCIATIIAFVVIIALTQEAKSTIIQCIKYNNTTYCDTALCGFGDSITAGYILPWGANSPPEVRYINQIQVYELDFPSLPPTWQEVQNEAIGASQVPSLAMAVFNDNHSLRKIQNDTKSVVLPGYNDMRHWGINVRGQVSFERGLYNHLAYLSLLDDAKVNIRNNVDESGTWSNFTGYGNVIGRQSTDNGATMSFTLHGPTFYISVLEREPGDGGGTFNIMVDETNKGTFNCSDYAGPVGYYHLYDYSPKLIRLTGFSDDDHNVTIEVTSPDGDGVYIMWAGPSSGKNIEDYTTDVWSGNVLRCKTYIPEGVGSDLAVSQFNVRIVSVVNSLSSDGLHIYYVDVDSYYDHDNHVCSDNVHPNIDGHNDISNAFNDFIENMASVFHPSGGL